MNRRTLAIVALVMAAVYVFWRLRQGPPTQDPGLPADEDEAAAERARFMTAVTAYGRRDGHG